MGHAGRLISPALWRELFQPANGASPGPCARLHVGSNRGNIADILPDYHEIGVDVMNISQPNAVDIAKVGASLRGRQCFMAPVSYQTVSITGTPEDIFNEAARLYRELGTAKGGFVGYVEEYGSIGMSEENYRACVDAWKER